ncbi:MAG: DUF460 domain-containing protein [archaeon]
MLLTTTFYKARVYNAFGDSIKPIIAGIDPGSTVGIAVLDVRGNIIDVESGKGLSASDVIFELQSYGEPLIIAADRNPAPKSVKKIAAAFNALSFVPEEHLSVLEKKQLVRPYLESLKLMNNHEKDALAAALKAFGFYSSKLRNLEKRYGKNYEQSLRSVLLRDI